MKARKAIVLESSSVGKVAARLSEAVVGEWGDTQKMAWRKMEVIRLFYAGGRSNGC